MVFIVCVFWFSAAKIIQDFAETIAIMSLFFTGGEIFYVFYVIYVAYVIYGICSVFYLYFTIISRIIATFAHSISQNRQTMKLKTHVFLLLLAMLAMTSCIKKEPLNTECDIVTISLPDNELNRSPIIENDRVTLIVKNYVNITDLAPVITVTPGATIVPESGTVRDFTEPQTYTVTSEDRQWSKTYIVTVQRNSNIRLNYSFENVKTQKTSGGGSYDVFYDFNDDEQTDTMFWASGNPGFAITNGSKGPDSYPTFQSAQGYKGKCAELITRSTGAWGAMVGMPIAAGNLFLGKFDLANAITRPLDATRFGTPFYSVPRYFNGVYRYTPGEKYQQKNSQGKLEEVPDRIDECNIYAVFYESTADMETLDGSNVLSDDNPNIIAVARLDENQRGLTADWAVFHLPFVFRPGKTVDPEKLENGLYNIAVVMTSSIEGAYFSGAVGSTLYVDELEIDCQ